MRGELILSSNAVSRLVIERHGRRLSAWCAPYDVLILLVMIPNLLISWLFLASLNLGEPAPNFKFESVLGTEETLEKLVEKGPVVLAFFPKAFTGGCTQEMTAMAKTYEKFQKQGVRVLAVSGDEAETLRRFADSLHAKFTFVPDTKGEVMKLFGVKMPLLTIAKRTTFLIGKGGIIRKVYSGKDAIALESLEAAVKEAVAAAKK